MTTHAPSIAVSVDIEAPASKLFALLARPANHPMIDGSGMLRGAEQPQVLSAVGDVFDMTMFNDEMGDYVIENHVVEFEPDRRIAWEPVLKWTAKPEAQDGVGNSAHARWGWELVALSEGRTRVTEFFDCTASPDWLRNATKEGERWRSTIEASLANLTKLSE